MPVISSLRTAIVTLGGTASSYAMIPLLRTLVATLGGTPTQYSVIGLLREAVTAAGGTPTQYTVTGLLRELLTARGLVPATWKLEALFAQLEAGRELVSNGAFASSTGWTLPAETTVSGGTLNFTALTANRSPSIVASETGVVGGTYRATFTITALTAGSARVSVFGKVSNTRTAVGTYTQDLVATAATTSILVTGFSGATLSIDNLSVRRVL